MPYSVRALFTRYQFGKCAEVWVAFFLLLKAYRILAIRHRTPVGEIDILARKAQTLIIVEVKARKSVEDAAHAISLRQRERLVQASHYLKAGNPEYAPLAIQFDCCLVSWYMGITHIKNAFSGG